MTAALRVLRAGLRDTWQDFFSTALCNLLWLVGVLLVIPAPPATLALFDYTNRLAHGETAGVGDFLRVFRRSWRTGWRWGVVVLAASALLAGDAFLTGRLSQSSLAHFAQGFYLAVLAAWLFLQLYILPFLLEQEKPSLLQALRNGAVFLGKNIGFSVWLFLLLAVSLALGTVLFMLSLAAGGVFLAAVANHAVIEKLSQ